ncbi:MAG: hypothetical protein ACR2LF_11915 [Jatrophihabitantaceae bacterium]
MRAPNRRLAAIALASTALIAGCSTNHGPRAEKTVYVDAPPTASSSSPGSTSARPSTSASVPTMTKLPGTCDDLLPLSSIDTALGGPVAGRTAFVVGVAEKDIGRISYLNCRYGLPGGATTAPTPRVEIGVSLYQTAALAAQRIPATVAAYLANGATQAPASVDGKPATILTGGVGTGYNAPTIVAVSGQRTIAVSLAADLAQGAEAAKRLTALAALAMKQTGG